MGCAQSKIENEESVSRCKDRRNFMKEAIMSRNAFASSHCGYAMALKNIGAAVSDYAQGEAEEIYHPHLGGSGSGGGKGGESSETAPPPPPNMEQPLPPPPPPLPTYSPVPPPLPSFSPTPTTPLQRSVTMPEISVVKKKGRWMDNEAILEEDENEEDNDDDDDINNDLRGRSGRMSGIRATRMDASPSPSPKTPVAVPLPPPESKGMAWDYFFMVDNMPETSVIENDEYSNDEKEEEDEEEEEDKNHFHHHRDVHLYYEQIEPKTPENVAMKGFETHEEETPWAMKDKQYTHSNTAPPDINLRDGGGAVNGDDGGMVDGSDSVSLLKILSGIDDHFLKASESAQEVSMILEATQLHYPSNFADNRVHIDHAARVMRVITWNPSFKGGPNGENGNDEFDQEKYETHATVLDKLLAWEKKLYEEVKAGELMKIEYQRKVAVLNRLTKRGASTESLEKAKAAVSHLHTRYIVDMQSLDSTVSEVNDIRDKQLYPKLVALVNGIAKMWDVMCQHHDDQLAIVADLKSLDVAGAPKETTKHHHERTIQLCHVVQGWRSNFEMLVTHQKSYTEALNNWLKLNLVPIESSLKETMPSPPHIQMPPIQTLLYSWHDHLQKLPDDLVKSAMMSFAVVIETIMNHQEEEMKVKEKCEETRKEFLRKNHSFEDWHQKYVMRRGVQDETEPNRVTGSGTDPVAERRFQVETLRKRLEDEMEAHQKLCVQVRDKSLGSLKIRLPELFRAMSDYAHVCRDSYQRLTSIIHAQDQQNGG